MNRTYTITCSLNLVSKNKDLAYKTINAILQRLTEDDEIISADIEQVADYIDVDENALSPLWNYPGPSSYPGHPI